MYVCDKDLHELLPQLSILSEDNDAPFKPEEQIQPSSIDLRLSAVFWRPVKTMTTVDLRFSQLLELEPRRYYQKEVLGPGGSIVLRPFELLLGRTMEEFSIPNGYAGELAGRSSFARLGLMVTATGGYINPGFKGHMPLQLLNLGPNPILVVPGLHMCQLRIVKLTGSAEKPYGDSTLQSIYINDDGGPSYWWKDKRIRALQKTLVQHSVEASIQHELFSAIASQEPEVIERAGKFITHRPPIKGQGSQVLDDFSETEDRRRTKRRWIINVCRASFSVGISLSVTVAFKLPPLRWWHVATWCATVPLIILSIYAMKTEVGDHFGKAELRRHRGGKNGTQ